MRAASPLPVLHGFRFSVYTRAAKLALEEKAVAYETAEVDPFAEDVPDAYLRLHPFGRVPALSHGDFDIYETAAIARYVDAAFDGPSLAPTDPRAAGRVAQVVSIVDSYAYWPMVRQVFAHRVFRPLFGEAADEAEIAEGLSRSRRVLSALDAIAAEGMALDGVAVTLADCHLASMIDYFARAPEGAEALAAHPSLSRWWAAVAQRPSLHATDPCLPDAPAA